PAPGQDDAVHAGAVHVHVPEPALRAGAVLDLVERVADRPAKVHGATQPGWDRTAEGRRAGPQEGVSGDDRGLPLEDTIVAVATAPGAGAIGVVRVSGRRAIACTSGLLQLR